MSEDDERVSAGSDRDAYDGDEPPRHFLAVSETRSPGTIDEGERSDPKGLRTRHRRRRNDGGDECERGTRPHSPHPVNDRPCRLSPTHPSFTATGAFGILTITVGRPSPTDILLFGIGGSLGDTE